MDGYEFGAMQGFSRIPRARWPENATKKRAMHFSS